MELKNLKSYLVKNTKVKKVNERKLELYDTIKKEIKTTYKFEQYINELGFDSDDGSYEYNSVKEFQDGFEEHVGESYEGCFISGELNYSLYEGSDCICNEHVVEFTYDFSGWKEKCKIEIEGSNVSDMLDNELESQAEKIISNILDIYPDKVDVRLKQELDEFLRKNYS